jgi:hypothetical protein
MPAEPIANYPPLADLETKILDALSRGSVPRTVWHLTPLDRWRLLRDTLLGHVTMRGDVRPRDLPLNPDCRMVIATAADLNRLEYWAGGYRCGRRMDSRFGDWLYTFAVLAEPVMPQTTSPNGIANAALAVCVREILLALDVADRDTPDDCRLLHRLLGVLGLSRQEWSRLIGTGKAQNAAIWELGEVARVAARICAHRTHPEWILRERSGEALVDFIIETDNGDAEDARRVRFLQREMRSLVSLKPVDVQTYIHRAKSHWMMRGASTWCAQSLAFARDLFLDSHPALLLSDSDAFVSFVVPLPLDAQAVVVEMANSWSDSATFGRRFPRLAPYFASLRSAGVSPLDSMPDISLRCTAPTSLLDYCLLRVDDTTYSESRVGWSDVRLPTPHESGHPCKHVENEAAIVESSPEWLEKRDGDRHSWPSLAWSLCGTTLRTHWHHGICAELGRSDYAMMHVHHGGWLRQLDMWHDRLTFVKLDGDGIGNTFESMPVPRRPVLGLSLGQAILQRVIGAMKSVIAKHDESEKPKFLPVDLVYHAGDDIVFCLPGAYLPAFLAGFGAPLNSDVADPWAGHTFSYVSIAVPTGADFSVADHIVRSVEFGRVNLAAARTLSPALRSLAKPRLRSDAALADLNAAIAKQGYRCEWAESPTGTGLAEGVSLNLIRVSAHPLEKC